MASSFFSCRRSRRDDAEEGDGAAWKLPLPPLPLLAECAERGDDTTPAAGGGDKPEKSKPKSS